ncbi:hypothetical protein [Streptomyces sirii]|uniref:hypothetical protein n=1 Tax=Streptomyces sirii TaxID=3127701 RepID=UPI003D36F1A6
MSLAFPVTSAVDWMVGYFFSSTPTKPHGGLSPPFFSLGMVQPFSAVRPVHGSTLSWLDLRTSGLSTTCTPGVKSKPLPSFSLASLIASSGE